MRIVFRADATRDVGAGHVMRCWALAEEFEARGADVSWQGAIEVPWLLSALGKRGWDIAMARGTEEDQAMAVRADAVVVDSYTLDDSYRQRLLERGTQVLAIVDDSWSETGAASLWINPGAPSSLRVDRPASFLNGPDYVLIRREIRSLRALRERRILLGVRPKGLTFLLGGTDASSMRHLVDAISDLSEFAGGLFAGPITDEGRSGVHWLRGGHELLKQASKSQLVVSAAGVSSWEMAYMGVPLALFQAADNQAGNYAWMTARGWALPLGKVDPNAVDPRRFREMLVGALAASEASFEPGTSRFDGLGASRVAEAAIRLL